MICRGASVCAFHFPLTLVKEITEDSFTGEFVFTSQQRDLCKMLPGLCKLCPAPACLILSAGSVGCPLTSSSTTLWPAFRAASKGPSRQANSPPLPPSTGRSAPNRSVMSYEKKKKWEGEANIIKKLTRSQDPKSKMILSLMPLLILIPNRELINFTIRSPGAPSHHSTLRIYQLES